MKIALITIHNANNYGAIFQAFATQEILSRYGHVTVINYDNKHISRSFELIRLTPSLRGVLGVGKDLLRLLPRYRAIKKFRAFININLNLSQQYDKEKLIAEGCPGFDIYVSGSDQIWNPSCIGNNKKFNEIYFLSFVKENKKCISYASSFGNYNFPSKLNDNLATLLKKYSMISVREDSSVSKLDAIGITAQQVLDPTLLIDHVSWLNYTNNKKRTEDSEQYILLYTVPKVALIRDIVNFVSKKLGLKVIALDQGLFAGAKVAQHIRDAGLNDFIRLFENSSFIITDSFHGVCFSINFSKKFVAVSPGIHSNRIDSLLSRTSLTERMVNNIDEMESFDLYKEIDVTDSLAKLREESICFLEKAINGE
ncbi:polysaccharide pyruvyl transferase family protein [Yersinia mollaretii]|uniref:polysaccharide pyruvyl transferase family protein n=1 Tax=Yersinia mollaretii TaxID=33060 RepID=UPI0025AB1798|nr:polysaccharide pyruvyl transferase family protein [Yersinia mollaretii]MDN0109156.1 polysaccharide pyruvyl transferase family protein [Yersinia mollaretii]